MLAVFAVVALLDIVALLATLFYLAWAFFQWHDVVVRKTRLRAAAISAGLWLVTAVAASAIAYLTPTASKPLVAKDAVAHPVTTNPGLLQFLTLRSGLNVYLDSPDDKAVLFDSLDTTRRWAMGNFRDNGEANGPADLPHVNLPVGTRVAVDSWASIPQLGDKAPMVVVKVHELTTPRRAGWTQDIFLVPILPAASVLVTRGLSAAATTGTVMDLAGPQTNKSNFVKLEPNTRVALIDSRPNGSEPYFARVLTGTHRGQRGYFSNLNLGAPSQPITSTDCDYDPGCKCVSLFLKDKWAYAIANSSPSH